MTRSERMRYSAEYSAPNIDQCKNPAIREPPCPDEVSDTGRGAPSRVPRAASSSHSARKSQIISVSFSTLDAIKSAPSAEKQSGIGSPVCGAASRANSSPLSTSRRRMAPRSATASTPSGPKAKRSARDGRHFLPRFGTPHAEAFPIVDAQPSAVRTERRECATSKGQILDVSAIGRVPNLEARGRPRPMATRDHPAAVWAEGGMAHVASRP